MSTPPPSTPPPGSEPPLAEDPLEIVEPPSAPIPLDADDTRGVHLRSLLRHPVTLSLTITGVIAGFVAGTLLASAPIGGAAAGGMLVIALIIVFAIATGRAKEDFLNAYAGGRGLVRQGKGPLEPMTPLLRRGDDRYADERMTGRLAGVEPGTLAHYTYEDRSTDSEGNQETTYYHFTVAICSIPESAEKAGELLCQRRFGFRFMDGFEDAFRKKQRVEVESEVMDKRFETFADPNASPVWLRRLFSPTFIVYLGEQAPKNFAFELVAGVPRLQRQGTPEERRRARRVLRRHRHGREAAARRVHRGLGRRAPARRDLVSVSSRAAIRARPRRGGPAGRPGTRRARCGLR